MANFLPAYEKTLLSEGGYQLTDIAHDKGGQTYAGIARKPNPQWAGWTYIDSGKEPPAELVRVFYKENFWEPLKLTALNSQKVAENLYDFAVNAGVGTAAKLAQIVAGVTPDGKVGPVTTANINAMHEDLFVAHYSLAKIARYRDIVRRDKTQIKFLMGWINRTLEKAA